MSYKLEYLPAARKDMLEIVRYISRDIGNPYAAKLSGGKDRKRGKLQEKCHISALPVSLFALLLMNT